MDSHNDLLGELAADAALERSDFIRQAAEQLHHFLERLVSKHAHEIDAGHGVTNLQCALDADSARTLCENHADVIGPVLPLLPAGVIPALPEELLPE